MELYFRLRSRNVLHRSWYKVRSSGLRSESERTRHDILLFDQNWLNNLDQIRDRLQKGTFAFAEEKGIALPKAKGKSGLRPLVVAPIANRVVRRAILETLQGYGDQDAAPSRHTWQGIPAIRKIMDTPTSVGGIAHRGVPHGLALVDRAVRNGACWFIRSDIRNFFTRIPKLKVSTFIRSAVNDLRFADLFDEALATNLQNQIELEERNLFKLFPDPEIGVAQGSALSALAGNIVLREFDTRMNGRGISCTRYIDDFILFGPSPSKVAAAYQSARMMLKEMGMDAYCLDDESAGREGKVDHGNIYNGTDFLGYRISGRSLQPCKAAITNFRRKLDNIVEAAEREMSAAAAGTSKSHFFRYHPSMIQLHKTIWGWSQSFKHTTVPHIFEQLDNEIDDRIEAIRVKARALIPSGDAQTRRRVMGVCLLRDAKPEPLPDIPSLSQRMISSEAA